MPFSCGGNRRYTPTLQPALISRDFVHYRNACQYDSSYATSAARFSVNVSHRIPFGFGKSYG